MHGNAIREGRNPSSFLTKGTNQSTGVGGFANPKLEGGGRGARRVGDDGSARGDAGSGMDAGYSGGAGAGEEEGGFGSSHTNGPQQHITDV